MKESIIRVWFSDAQNRVGPEANAAFKAWIKAQYPAIDDVSKASPEYYAISQGFRFSPSTQDWNHLAQ